MNKPTTSESSSKKTDEIARIDLSGMNSFGYGFRTSVDGTRTGGVFVKKEAAADLAGSYVHEDSALDALAPERTTEEIEGIRDSLSDAKRLTVDDFPDAKRPHDRVVGVEIGDKKVGGGAKFIGNKEILLPNGRYVNEADLKAAIANFRKVSAPVAVDKYGSRGGGNVLRPRVRGALAGALALLVLLTLSPNQEGPEKERAVATAVAHEDIPDVLPPEEPEPTQAEEEPPVPETTQNWYISDGMGGEGLFKQLNIDPAQWYAIQAQLYAQYPGYFYQEPNGDVRFDHAGDVPPEIQETILSLLSNLESQPS